MRVNPLKTHLFWFVVFGLAIFGIDALRNSPDQNIVVDDAVVARLTGLWRGQMQREPAPGELEGIIATWVDEEMLYREARRLGLDEEDVIVRRRLVQKMTFVAEESAAQVPPDEVLIAWFQDHRDDYRLPTQYSFSHVFFRDADDGEKIALALESGTDWRTLGDAGMMNPSFVRRSAEDIKTAFGADFAQSLSALGPSADWQGPLRSEFGWHMVQLREVREPVLPTFESVRSQVLNDYLFDARENARRQVLDALRERYHVIWKAAHAS
ncbi:MAG: peptidyl-prolyl cis-trans isomerase [Pseudomonadales bacterium]|nr:peptidyl-prolyl cis-trans isomerase [Pseudomonadales bacterium]